MVADLTLSGPVLNGAADDDPPTLDINPILCKVPLLTGTTRLLFIVTLKGTLSMDMIRVTNVGNGMLPMGCLESWALIIT